VKLGRDPDIIVKAPFDWGFGDDAYPAQVSILNGHASSCPDDSQVDAFHEIHCLNQLRKEMVSHHCFLMPLADMWSQYWDHYYRPTFGGPENANYLHIRHKRHCLRIVLRTLMCTADVDIVTHNWRRGSYRPIADFDNPRQCRNFENLLEWNMKHAVPDDMEKWRTIKRPSNAVILPKPTPNLYTSEDSYEWMNNV
jgi:hypothetical protein